MIEKIFEEIITCLRSGEYTRVNIHGRKVGFRFDNRITDEVELFNEASKTLLYYWGVANGDARWQHYYRTICKISNAPSLSGVPFIDVVTVICPDTKGW